MTDAPSDNGSSTADVLRIASSLSELAGDAKRQATPSIRGTVYQALCSIDAWLRLCDANEVIYLEGAEDFDIIRGDGSALTIQVRATRRSISLGDTKAISALEEFWRLAMREASRRVDFHYLTTSATALETDQPFGDLSGIDAWRIGQTNLEVAGKIAAYLAEKLPVDSLLRAFLTSSANEAIQERLLRRFHWLTDQPDMEAVRRSVEDRIVALLNQQRQSVELAPDVRAFLESRFWEIITQQSSAARSLTHAELVRQVERATSVRLLIPRDQMPALLASQYPGSGLLDVLLQKSPTPPEPLLNRTALTERLAEFVRQRKFVLITGTVHKGKTTLAQLVVAALTPDAWWISLTERPAREVDLLFLALARRIDQGSAPALIVVDDLDIRETAHRAYRDSLTLMLHRARTSGRGVIFTAQGASDSSGPVRDFGDMVLLEVSELDVEETKALCLEHGCPEEELAGVWSTVIAVSTLGHPKLVHVRIGECVARNWPRPSMTDLTAPSLGVVSTKQLARRLLSESVTGPVAEFVYTASESSVLLERSVAMRLAESVDGLSNAGDVIDGLAGRWVERVSDRWFRVTALLKGIASDVWSEPRRKRAHLHIHDAIHSKRILDPSEGAALLFHAYVGGDEPRTLFAAMHLQMISDDEAKRAVDRALLWLPHLALEEGQQALGDPMAAAALRALQFRVASTLESENIPTICARWREDIERIEDGERKLVSNAVMWMSCAFSLNPKVELKWRLDAARNLPELPDELKEGQRESAKRLHADLPDFPPNATISQLVLSCATRAVNSQAALCELLDWLSETATDDIRQQFETMLEWPLVQELGAFVQTAWAAVHADVTDWRDWLLLFERIERFAEATGLRRFGREAAKARAIVLSEYLSCSDEAFSALDNAVRVFGSSPVLLEQRANVWYQLRDDAKVLAVWQQLTSDPQNPAPRDPFAYRRAAVSAARLHQWNRAAELFQAAKKFVPDASVEPTKFGFMIDAALCEVLGRRRARAADLLLIALGDLPIEASAESSPRWEAALRVASEVCRITERKRGGGEVESELEPGRASSPNLHVAKSEPGQPARCALTKAMILCLAASIKRDANDLSSAISELQGSAYIGVRWLASQAELARVFGGGAGKGFVPALLAFAAANADVIANPERGRLLQPDDGRDPSLQPTLEHWFGLLVVGAVCSEDALIEHLRQWLADSVAALGADSGLGQLIEALLDGATRQSDRLWSVAADTSNSPVLRSGAATRLLRTEQSASRTFQLQHLLASAMMGDLSRTQQDVFNLHVARRFARAWTVAAEPQHRFQFVAPRVTVPRLLASIDELDEADGTLRTLLSASRDAVGARFGEFMSHVF